MAVLSFKGMIAA